MALAEGPQSAEYTASGSGQFMIIRSPRKGGFGGREGFQKMLGAPGRHSGILQYLRLHSASTLAVLPIS